MSKPPLVWPSKGPDEIVERFVDFAPALAEGQLIDVVTWTFPVGIVQVANSASIVDAKAVVFISGGTDGVAYDIGCHITTKGTLVEEQTARIRQLVKNR